MIFIFALFGLNRGRQLKRNEIAKVHSVTANTKIYIHTENLHYFV